MPQILNFNLFGEAGDLPDVVHCETIQTRSRLHNWEFAPHRHARLHQVLYLAQGGGRVTLDGAPQQIAPQDVVNVPLGLVHGFSFQPGTEGLVVTLAAEMLDQALLPVEGLRPVLMRPAVLRCAQDTRGTLEQILAAFSGRAFGRAQILRSLAGLLLGQIARDLTEGESPGAAPARPDLLARFEALIEARYTDHRPVADYAADLGVSPTHLSRVCRAATGRPASALIEDRLIREARRNLVYTNLTVATIAYALGFSDPAYFTRVFTRATGLAPRAFRDQAQTG
ncbi:helix-turn-helix domain-containing protein [Mesobacterium sp. TK19101]|uniref:Helix-turn-helix domain-containing protein n=2 Tax=Mesobacterium hydrothermale TaxID=3111907 RepID=A0ABU6HIC2_9RHOB|nr:helix-turn-helix domain-containing protein [Mesobacterium sp. TK19101]